MEITFIVLSLFLSSIRVWAEKPEVDTFFPDYELLGSAEKQWDGVWDDLPEELAGEMKMLLELEETEACVISDLEKIRNEVPGFLEGHGVSFICPEEDDFLEKSPAILYRKNGAIHTYMPGSETEITDELVTEFTEEVNELLESELMRTNSGSGRFLSVIIREEYFPDTYQEAGAVTTGVKCGYKTYFLIYKDTAEYGDYDLYMVRAIHKIKPYAGVMYTTITYLFGMGALYANSEILSGAPLTNTISLNQNQNYSFSVSFPWSISLDLNWNRPSGTQMTALLEDSATNIYPSYIIDFTNVDGVFGNSDSGDFQYETVAEYLVQKNGSFGFRYKESFTNSVYGGYTDAHVYGYTYRLITGETIGEAEESLAGEGYLIGTMDYGLVFDPDYYFSHHPDILNAYGYDRSAAFTHFLTNGMDEGRQAKADFNVYAYKNRYADLRAAFGNNLRLYYEHYINNGYAEGRIGS